MSTNTLQTAIPSRRLGSAGPVVSAIALPMGLCRARVSVTLSSDELAEIDPVAPRGVIAGERYPKEQMAWLDSERGSASPSATERQNLNGER